MAIYVSNRRSVAGLNGRRTREILEMTMDSAADVPNLPSKEKVLEGSTAFDMATSQVYMLKDSGWGLI